MKKLVPMLASVCLILALALTMCTAPTAEAANEEVSFKVTNVTLEKDTVVLKGNFINNSDVYQRVLGMKLKYVLRDEEGYPIMMGSFSDDHLKVDIGSDPVPYTVKVQDKDAIYKNQSDIVTWKIDCDLTLE